MSAWIAAVRHAKDIRSVPPCANEDCTAGRWQLWLRRDTGIRLNDRWYCSADCLQYAVALVVAASQRTPSESRPSAHRLPLGLLMLSRGIIDETQLRAALAVQGERPAMKIGQCLETLGAVTGQEVTRALGAQHCLPVLVAFQPELDGGIPLALLESSRCAAFCGAYHPGLLYVGFDGAIDRPLLAAAELVLGRQCEPCIVDTRVIEEHLELRRQSRSPNEIVFGTKSSNGDIVRSIQSYVQQVRAGRVRLAATRQHLWVNLSGTRSLDLLFRLG